jgi:uncharacterized membrane protein YgcG
MKKLVFAFSTLAIISIASVPGRVYADVNDFVVNKFKADYNIDNLKPGGSLNTVEQIDITFHDQNHGILRAIPQKYHNYSTRISGILVERDGQQEQFTTYKENGNLVLKIGDPNKTITGKHSYKIRYLQERIINFQGNQASFYWDVNGDQWMQSFEQVEANVSVKGKQLDASKATCYTGFKGYQRHDCSISEQNGSLNFQTSRKFLGKENMSVEIPLEGVTFTQPSIAALAGDNLVILAGLLIGIASTVVAFLMWVRYGKDYHGRGIIVPEYEVPQSLTPAEIGLLADYNVDGKDVSATLVDLAVRGYVRLHDDSKKIIFFTQRHFRLELLKNDFSNLKSHEKELLEAIFTNQQVGNVIELNKLNKTSMAIALQNIKKDLSKSLTDQYGLFEKKAAKQQTIMTLAGAALFVGGGFLPLSGPIRAGLITGAVMFILFGVLMQRRSHAGVEMYEKVKGLELYMKTAEADRLKMMQSVDRPYAEPSKTVELFEKLLPYAVALGVEKSWARQFDEILTGDIDWYTGNNLNSFNAGYLASSLGDATSSFSKSFESGSGSSGGSGGGGGGGGGGGW